MTNPTDNWTSGDQNAWEAPVALPQSGFNTPNQSSKPIPSGKSSQSAKGKVELVNRSRTATNTKIKVPRRELYNMTSQLAIMTQSGVDISSALVSMAKQCKRPGLKRILETINSEIIDGRRFSDALRIFPNVFNETYTTTIGAGESSGNLSSVLAQLAKLQRNEIRLRSSNQKVLIYPIILASVSGIVLLGMVLFVLPQFAGVFKQFDAELPFVTQMLIDLSTFMRSNSLICLAIAGLMITAVLMLRFSQAGQRWLDHFFLHAPMIKNATQALYFGRVCRLMGLMLESGVPLLETLGLAKNSIRNQEYRKMFEGIEDDVLNGGGLSRGLLQSEFVPPAAAEMVITGEQTGSLGTVTQLVGEHYEEEGEARLRDFVTLLEPAITIVMGSLVAIVVMSVLLPMFDIATFANK